MRFALLLLSIFSFKARSEVFTHKFSKAPAREIKIEQLNGFHVNDECIKNKKECLSLILRPFKEDPIKSAKTKQAPHVLGNPASDFCKVNHGNSEILQDKKNNEYDYCVFKDKYFVDSWDFFSLNKQ